MKLHKMLNLTIFKSVFQLFNYDSIVPVAFFMSRSSTKLDSLLVLKHMEKDFSEKQKLLGVSLYGVVLDCDWSERLALITFL